MSARSLNPALLVTALVVIVAACMLGSTPMDVPRVLAALLGNSTPADSVVVWQIRLPRALVAFVVGSALGARDRKSVV